MACIMSIMACIVVCIMTCIIAWWKPMKINHWEPIYDNLWNYYVWEPMKIVHSPLHTRRKRPCSSAALSAVTSVWSHGTLTASARGLHYQPPASPLSRQCSLVTVSPLRYCCVFGEWCRREWRICRVCWSRPLPLASSTRPVTVRVFWISQVLRKCKRMIEGDNTTSLFKH